MKLFDDGLELLPLDEAELEKGDDEATRTAVTVGDLSEERNALLGDSTPIETCFSLLNISERETNFLFNGELIDDL